MAVRILTRILLFEISTALHDGHSKPYGKNRTTKKKNNIILFCITRKKKCMQKWKKWKQTQKTASTRNGALCATRKTTETDVIALNNESKLDDQRTTNHSTQEWGGRNAMARFISMYLSFCFENVFVCERTYGRNVVWVYVDDAQYTHISIAHLYIGLEIGMWMQFYRLVRLPLHVCVWESVSTLVCWCCAEWFGFGFWKCFERTHTHSHTPA